MAQPREQQQQHQPSSSPVSSREGDSRSSTNRTRPSPIIHPQSISTGSLSSNASASTFNSSATTPRRDPSINPSPSVSKRSSYAENLNLRSYPSSPRAQRTLSFSGSALTELLMTPTHKAGGDEARFAGRDWRSIQVSEIIDAGETRFVEFDTSIEDTTKLLIRSGAPNVVLVRESRNTKTPIDTFDYSDLNAYLLLVLGMAQADDEAAKIAERTRAGDVIPLRDVTDHLGAREEPIFVPHTATLIKTMEVLGGGHHRVIICKEGTREAVGVLSQLRLVRFFWDNHENFSVTEQLYSRTLRELELGVKDVLAINGDKPLSDALLLMHNEGITSLPILDNQHNVVGNISHVDVRLLTDTSAIPLLSSSCIHFISVILSERGMWDGKDAYPVFHVNHFSTLAHTVAKLCATRSHRMWIVDAPSPSTSVPPSPGLTTHAFPPSALQQNLPPPSPHHLPPPASPASTARHPSISDHPIPGAPPYPSLNPPISVSAAQLPGQGLSGRLSGVVSLTDILNLFARASGLSPADPEETRRRRRQSSSASGRPSFDGIGRPSAEILRAAIGGGAGGGGGGTANGGLGLGRSSSRGSSRGRR